MQLLASSYMLNFLQKRLISINSTFLTLSFEFNLLFNLTNCLDKLFIKASNSLNCD